MSKNNKNDSSWSLAQLSIKRPIFISCVVFLMLVLGYISLGRLPIDLFPNVTFPVVSVITPYPGAGPKEVETLISKVYEEELATIAGIKSLKSKNQEGVSIVIAEFSFKTDIKYAEQQVRDKVSSAKSKLPSDVGTPVIRRIDPADQPIISVSLQANLEDAELYDLAAFTVKNKLEQINQVGLVEILGGRKREIKVEMDLNKLKSREVSALMVNDALAKAGQNIPSGKVNVSEKQETVFRTLGEFTSIDEIKKTIVSFFGNDVPVTLEDVATVSDGLVDEKNLTFVNGKKSLLLNIYRQSGANTVQVANDVVKTVDTLNTQLATISKGANIQIVRDGAWPIRENIKDVRESIFIGIVLTVLVVFFFLGSLRSTLITGLALPNSLLGAFILISIAGFSINIMSLLALSLAVGLLVDDAIVVRENIFRHLEMGKPSHIAAIDGTKEVTLAVIATTATVIAVFGPIAFLDGVVGQFFKEFGLTICFALIISLFDALTIAPMMSAYFAGNQQGTNPTLNWYDKSIGRVLKSFDRFQNWLEDLYVKTLEVTLKHPLKIIFSSIGIFVISIFSLKYVSKTFLPPQDQGEFSIGLELDPGTGLEEMNRVAGLVDQKLRSHPEVDLSLLTVGTTEGEANKANFYVKLTPRKMRKLDTIQFKEILRQELVEYSYARPQVKDFDAVGGGMRPFSLNIRGDDEKALAEFSTKAFEKLKNHPALKDVDLNYRAGKPEFQVIPDRQKAEAMGISTNVLGMELRTLIEGQTPAVFRLHGEEYDVRVRLQEEQRNLQKSFANIQIPNINYRMISLSQVAKGVETTGPATINRQDRGRYYQIAADISPTGPGLGGAIGDVKKLFDDELKLPDGISYSFVGQAENFQELVINMGKAALLGILFIYLVLASLYESFITPLTIMLVLPLAASGGFFALLVTNSSLDLFSMIGCIMLLGVATKNSIILVDYTNQQVQKGLSFHQAILLAGKNRLRPILMTSLALIAGMIPIAIGLNEASKQRTSMGIAVIGGLISSTLLTLVVVPAAYSYIERFRQWLARLSKKVVTQNDIHSPSAGE